MNIVVFKRFELWIAVLLMINAIFCVFFTQLNTEIDTLESGIKLAQTEIGTMKARVLNLNDKLMVTEARLNQRIAFVETAKMLSGNP